MRCVYRITCLATGKSYVGQTIQRRLKLRWQQHLSELRRNIHYNQHLQRAYNKYGEESFHFEILESGIEPFSIDQREIDWISYFDSFNDGYNKTPGGNSGDFKAIPCTWNGISYPSIKAAALALGISPSSMQQRVHNGYASDSELNPHRRAVMWNGIEYPSITAAAKAIGVSKEVLQKRLSKGYKCDTDMPGTGSSPTLKDCRWNGVAYLSIKEAAAANGYTLSMLSRHIKGGKSRDEDVRPRKKPCIWNGIEYSSLRVAATALGIKLSTFHRWVSRGYTCDNDVLRLRRGGR